MIIEVDILAVILYAICIFIFGFLAGCAFGIDFEIIMEIRQKDGERYLTDSATERFLHFKEELSKLDGKIILVDDGAGDSEDGIDAALVIITHHGDYTDVELFFTGDSDGRSLHEQLESNPKSRFYKLKKGDEI